MFSSIKYRKPTVYFLAWSLVVAVILQSATRPGDASHGAKSTRLTPIVKESNESAESEAGAVDEATQARVSAAYNKLPLRFEENRGQVDKQVKYLSRSAASTLFLTQSEAVLTLSTSVVRMKLHGANRSPRITGEREMAARTNYFIGNDPQQWHGDVAQYERVGYAEVYPGIDLLYYGQQQSLEYDFEVAPGADPRRIVLGFKGIKGLKIERATGDLLLETASGEVRQHKPVVYQEVDGEQLEIEGQYVMKGKRKVGFKIGAYDQTKALVIDPVLAYSTYRPRLNHMKKIKPETSLALIIDPRHPLYGRTFPLKKIIARRGTHGICLIEFDKGTNHLVPIEATDKSSIPLDIHEVPVSVQSLTALSKIYFHSPCDAEE